MAAVPAKHVQAVDDAISSLISRAADSRGLSTDDLRPRVDLALGKYLLNDQADADRNAIKQFVDDIRADDLCLIIACEKGDEKAWEYLVSNFDSTVKSAARKISPNSEDAEDLASSIWAELYGLRQDADGNKKSKLSYYSGRGSLAGWLRAVVSQLAIDEYRKQSRYVQIEENREFENLAEESSNNSDNHNVVHHADNPEELLTVEQTSNDVSLALKHAVEALDAEDRLVMKLYYFDDLKLKEIAAMFVGQRGQSPIIQYHEVSLGKTPEEAPIAAIAFGHSQFPKEPWESQIQGREAQPAGHLCQRTGQVGFAGAGRPDDQHIVMAANPLAGGERRDHAFVQPSGMAIIQIFQRGAAGEPGLGQPPRQAAILLSRPFPIDQEPQPFLEAEPLHVGHLQLFRQGRGHAGEFQRLQGRECGMT